LGPGGSEGFEGFEFVGPVVRCVVMAVVVSVLVGPAFGPEAGLDGFGVPVELVELVELVGFFELAGLVELEVALVAEPVPVECEVLVELGAGLLVLGLVVAEAFPAIEYASEGAAVEAFEPESTVPPAASGGVVGSLLSHPFSVRFVSLSVCARS
jgi:hypothetical protein